MDSDFERAWEDWLWLENGLDTLDDLEDQGYKWQYTVAAGSHVPDSIGEHALIVGEFSLADVVVTKKLIKPRILAEYGIKPVGWDTRKRVALQRVLHFYENTDDEPVELYHSGQKAAALVHPATRKGVGWQGSKFDEWGPFSHVEGKSQLDVITRLVEDGFTEPSPGAVERIFKYRENPVSDYLSFAGNKSSIR